MALLNIFIIFIFYILIWPILHKRKLPLLRFFTGNAACRISLLPVSLAARGAGSIIGFADRSLWWRAHLWFTQIRSFKITPRLGPMIVRWRRGTMMMMRMTRIKWALLYSKKYRVLSLIVSQIARFFVKKQKITYIYTVAIYCHISFLHRFINMAKEMMQVTLLLEFIKDLTINI